MWILAIWLYLNFTFNPDVYRQLKADGATCYVYVSDHGEKANAPPPPCWYDPEPLPQKEGREQ